MAFLVQLRCARFEIARILHTISVERMSTASISGGLVVGRHRVPACTPYGVLKLLEHEPFRSKAKNVVVVGASNIVGKPMALMLMQREAT